MSSRRCFNIRYRLIQQQRVDRRRYDVRKRRDVDLIHIDIASASNRRFTPNGDLAYVANYFSKIGLSLLTVLLTKIFSWVMTNRWILL